MQFVRNNSPDNEILSMRRQSAYYCNQCGKPFADDDEWEQHIRTHAEIKPFSCDVCGKSFLNEFDLITHVKKNHPHSDELLYIQKGNTRRWCQMHRGLLNASGLSNTTHGLGQPLKLPYMILMYV